MMHWAMVPTLLSLIEPSPSPVIPSLVLIFTKQQLPSTRNVSTAVILIPGYFALPSSAIVSVSLKVLSKGIPERIRIAIA